MNRLEGKLVKLLHSVAAYNDKGYLWRNDSPEQTERMHAEWRQELDALIAEIGESNFSADLLVKLHGSDVVQDWSGRYAEDVSAWFSTGEQ